MRMDQLSLSSVLEKREEGLWKWRRFTCLEQKEESMSEDREMAAAEVAAHKFSWFLGSRLFSPTFAYLESRLSHELIPLCGLLSLT